MSCGETPAYILTQSLPTLLTRCGPFNNGDFEGAPLYLEDVMGKRPKAGRDSGRNGRRVGSGIFIAPVSNVSHRLLPGPQHFAEASER